MSPNAARFLIVLSSLFAISCLYDSLFGYDSVFYPQPSWEECSVINVDEVRCGSRRRMWCPPPSVLAEASNDDEFVRNLRDLSLHNDLSDYSQSVRKLVNLKRVGLSFTKNTSEFLESLPPGVTSLILDGTDLYKSPNGGMCWSEDHSDRLLSRMQLIADRESLEELFIGPWDKRFTAPACECLPELQSLRKLKIEWGTERDIAALRAALPNCKVILITEH